MRVLCLGRGDASRWQKPTRFSDLPRASNRSHLSEPGSPACQTFQHPASAAPLSSAAAAAAAGERPEQRPGRPASGGGGHVVAEASPGGGGEPGSHPPLQTPARPTACGGERSRACRPPSRPCGSP